MKTFLAALGVAAIALPALAQTPSQSPESSATKNPPSTAIGSGTAKALQGARETAKPAHHKSVHRAHKAPSGTSG